jgi:hypothetical protein
MDIYDGAEWTEDLQAELAHGRSIDEAAQFLCAGPKASSMSSARRRTSG